MVPCLKILLTKSRDGIDIPLNSRRTVEGQTVEVLGLLKKEVKNRVVLQWWIVNLVEKNRKHRCLCGGMKGEIQK